jgi:hypothetical protein
MASESEEEPVREAYDTVTPPYKGRSDTEMNLIGYMIIGGLLILLVPLAPFILVLWLASRLLRGRQEEA